MKLKFAGPTMAVAMVMCAMQVAVAAEPQTAPVGTDTRAWLQLQASGNASKGELRPMPGEVADKVYDRYLQSFDNQIPDEFERETFVSGGSGS
ncbi:DUF3613 domain-containing protein [Sinimarinibacterium flocculans]|uniref:Uncharacterized protein DUF3613 n=1 Tax=Sinimarinibacterium flocculans TaxID=985250 RepID=A0A318EDT1_9GAMM|nr:DUF3613 domain-containing protein [Sinimarinibacterium flocculans]PXV70232.1 uncharacterized protein DUF3613 [Sinimarinibacterium flocculans]